MLKIIYLHFRFKWAFCMYPAMLLSTAKLRAFAWFHHVEEGHTCVGSYVTWGGSYVGIWRHSFIGLEGAMVSEQLLSCEKSCRCLG